MESLSPHLPVTRSLTLAYACSLIVAILMAGASVIGLLSPGVVYPTEELRQTSTANDVVNLAIGLPILLGSMWLARRGKLIGLLLWPGALFYVPYNSIAYLFSLPLNVAFLLHLALLALSVYTVIGLVASVDRKAVQQRLAGAVPEKVTGGVMAGLALLFLLRAIGIIINAFVSQTPVPATELPALVADIMLAPAWIIGGTLLWRREPLGYVGGLGLLFQLSMLFVGLICFMLFAQFALTDVAVVFVMGLVCFVPFALFVRGVLAKEKHPFSPPERK